MCQDEASGILLIIVFGVKDLRVMTDCWQLPALLCELFHKLLALSALCDLQRVLAASAHGEIAWRIGESVNSPRAVCQVAGSVGCL